MGPTKHDNVNHSIQINKVFKPPLAVQNEARKAFPNLNGQTAVGLGNQKSSGAHHHQINQPTILYAIEATTM